MDKIIIKDLHARGILGVYDWERGQPREIVLNLVIFTDTAAAARSDTLRDCVDYDALARQITALVERSRRQTVEALSADIAALCLEMPLVQGVQVRVEKPGAVDNARSAGVAVERWKKHLKIISFAHHKRVFGLLLGVAILLLGVFAVTGAPLVTDDAPYGVVSFELAGTPENAQRILAGWNAEARLRAAFGLGLDYLFMVVYASTIALGISMAARSLYRAGWPFARWGGLLTRGVVLAALLDAVENAALLILLWGTLTDPWPALARWCAVPKFVLIFIGIAYAFYGGAAALAGRIEH
jgi:dihydroneopterin aldolase/D-erythro-7,8-dihydroneopterin triphosphate epimerase